MKWALVVVGVAMLTSPALADPWKDESGKGRWGYERGGYYGRDYDDREYKQKFYRGRCKVERKWGKRGEYKEETKCKGYR